MTDRDWSLRSGERQIGRSMAEVRFDHRVRYEYADMALPQGSSGLDAFCGTGYGSYHLANSGNRRIVGIDGSSESIEYAQAHANAQPSMTHYRTIKWPMVNGWEWGGAFDWITSFESIEHVEDGEGFFRWLVDCLMPGGDLIFSVPCEDHLPQALFGNRFHFKHYTMPEVMMLALSNGCEVRSWCGQDVYALDGEGRRAGLLPESKMILRLYEPGQFVMIHARKL